MVYPHKWSPVRCRSNAGQGKFAGQRPTFYHCATQPTNHCSLICRLWNLLSHSLGGSTWRRAWAYRIESDILVSFTLVFWFLQELQLLPDTCLSNVCKHEFTRRYPISINCLHPLLPPDRTLNQVLRTRGHSFQLPTCSFNLHKKSFVISCLFKYLTWVCSCFVCVVFFIFKLFFFKCFSNFLVSLLTFSCNFCPLLWIAPCEYYCYIYKSITACTFVAAIQ